LKVEVNILKKEKTEIEFEIIGEDTTVPGILVNRLNTYSEVEFAAYKAEHPLIPKPRVIVRVKKGDPVKSIEKAIKELSAEVAEFRGIISKMK
jgi:DNA-directed RNA polymerase subunit L